MSDDLISRQTAVELSCNVPIAPLIQGEGIHYEDIIFTDHIKRLPIVQPEQKTGRWIETDDYDAWRCSECDEYFCLDEGTPQDNKYYYCPNCGAKMRTENG